VPVSRSRAGAKRIEINRGPAARDVSSNEGRVDEARGIYTGWIAGALVVAAVFGVGVVIWFLHHPFPRGLFHL
jgi:hypothetical protein